MNLLSFSGSGLLAVVTDDRAHDNPLRVDYFGVPDPITEQGLLMPAVSLYALASKPLPVHNQSFPVKPVRRWLKSHQHLTRFVDHASAAGLDVLYAAGEGSFEQVRSQALGVYQQHLFENGASVSKEDVLETLESMGGECPYRGISHYLSQEFNHLTETLHHIYEQQEPARKHEVEVLAEYAIDSDLGLSDLQVGLEARLRIGLDDALARQVLAERAYEQEFARNPSMRTRDNYVIGKENVRKALHERINKEYFPEL